MEKSGFLDLVDIGDDYMADKGFLIRRLLGMRGATLNMPPFSHGRQLASRAVTRTRRIASARIHVERAIRRLKAFRILNGPIPLQMAEEIDLIIPVCAALCNLQGFLVHE